MHKNKEKNTEHQLKLLLTNLSKGENKMANINYSLVVASQLGALLGMNLIHIRRKNVDPDYSNKEREGKQRLAIPVYIYGIDRIKIKKAELVDLGEGQRIVQFNDDPKLQLSLANAKDITDVIKKPTVQEVANAVMAEEASAQQTFFVDDKTATELAVSFNNRSYKELSSMMEVLSRQAACLTDANDAMMNACKLEMAQVGKSVDFVPINVNETK
nr:MAG: hypothetical protein [Bacteriophage sp.]